MWFFNLSHRVTKNASFKIFAREHTSLTRHFISFKKKCVATKSVVKT